MRMRAATIVVALFALLAAPATLAKATVSVEGQLIAALRGGHLLGTPIAATRKDSLRSCQAGAERSRARAATETERRASTVACEQPPRSNLSLSSGLKSAEASAIAAAG
jgi:hypothetical protein